MSVDLWGNRKKPSKSLASRPSMSRMELSEADMRKLRAALAVIETFFKFRKTMPAQYIRTFLLVALDEGRGVLEYAERAGVAQSVMSRHLQDIGPRNRKKEEGFGLVESRDNPMELRKHQLTLTPRGRALAHQIIRNME
jgi:hypothetical protein